MRPQEFVNKQSGIRANVLISRFVLWSLFPSMQDAELKTGISLFLKKKKKMSDTLSKICSFKIDMYLLLKSEFKVRLALNCTAQVNSDVPSACSF